MLSIPELQQFFTQLNLSGASANIIQQALANGDIDTLNRLVNYFKIHYKELKKRSFKKRIRYVFEKSQKIFNQIYADNSKITCGRGCNYCCCGSRIAASKTEIRALIEHCQTNNITIDLKQVQFLIDDDGKFEGDFKSLRCPFLANDGCRVYEARPLNCRTKFSIDDPEKCNEESDKWNGSFRFYANEELEMLKAALHMLDEPRNFFVLVKEIIDEGT